MLRKNKFLAFLEVKFFRGVAPGAAGIQKIFALFAL